MGYRANESKSMNQRVKGLEKKADKDVKIMNNFLHDYKKDTERSKEENTYLSEQIKEVEEELHIFEEHIQRKIDETNNMVKDIINAGINDNEILRQSIILVETNCIEELSKTDKVIHILDEKLEKEIHVRRESNRNFENRTLEEIKNLKKENKDLVITQVALEWIIGIMIVVYIAVEYVTAIC